jgi:hypothetical protein
MSMGSSERFSWDLFSINVFEWIARHLIKDLGFWVQGVLYYPVMKERYNCLFMGLSGHNYLEQNEKRKTKQNIFV